MAPYVDALLSMYSTTDIKPHNLRLDRVYVTAGIPGALEHTMQLCTNKQQLVPSDEHARD